MTTKEYDKRVADIKQKALEILQWDLWALQESVQGAFFEEPTPSQQVQILEQDKLLKKEIEDTGDKHKYCLLEIN